MKIYIKSCYTHDIMSIEIISTENVLNYILKINESLRFLQNNYFDYAFLFVFLGSFVLFIFAIYHHNNIHIIVYCNRNYLKTAFINCGTFTFTYKTNTLSRSYCLGLYLVQFCCLSKYILPFTVLYYPSCSCSKFIMSLTKFNDYSTQWNYGNDLNWKYPQNGNLYIFSKQNT